MNYDDIKVGQAYYIVTEPSPIDKKPRAFAAVVTNKADHLGLIRIGNYGHEHFYTAEQFVKPALRSDPAYIYLKEYPCSNLGSLRYSDLIKYVPKIDL